MGKGKEEVRRRIPPTGNVIPEQTHKLINM